MFAADLLQDKVVLVTGGGSGLGRAMGERFLALGAKLVITGRRKEVLEQTAAELPGDVLALPCDVRDPAAVAATWTPESAWTAERLDATREAVCSCESSSAVVVDSFKVGSPSSSSSSSLGLFSCAQPARTQVGRGCSRAQRLSGRSA